jgi:hypothetical protein
MIPHQAVGMAEPSTAIDRVSENGQKSLTIIIIFKDILPGITPAGEVVDGAWIF